MFFFLSFAFLTSVVFFLPLFSAGELGNAVQDAFVIAVEQQARERLQRLSALKRITPIDMSQLSIQVISKSMAKKLFLNQFERISVLIWRAKTIIENRKTKIMCN